MNMTAEAIKAETGFTLWMSLPYWRTDRGVSFIESIEKQTALANQIGAENVLSSFYLDVDEEQLLFGVFVRHPEIIDGELANRSLPHAPKAIDA